MIKEKNQVKLEKLVFTQNWEDPASDHAALKIKPGDSIMAITSGGCNVLGFLLFDPKVVYSIDINAAQSYILELKIAAIKAFQYDQFVAFAGLEAHGDRLSLFTKIKTHLSTKALEFWERNQRIIKEGFIMNGKYERFIKKAGKFINMLQGRKRVLGLFIEKTTAEQELYFDKMWNTRRFHYLFKILFNKRILARKGLVADYFHFDDGSKSFAENFYNRSKKAFRNIPIKENYFVSLYMLGKYRNNFEVPAYLKKENYQIIKSRIDRIQIITDEAQHWLGNAAGESIDCFALSNICELMSEGDTLKLFTEVERTARKEARVIFRNLMVPREVPDALKVIIVKDEVLSKQIYDNDRSFVYGKVAAYSIKK